MRPDSARDSTDSNSSALGKRKLHEDHGALDADGGLRRQHASSDSDSDGEHSPSDDGGYGGEEEEEEEEELVIDRKHLLIVKDGTIRVAESLEQQQFDANGEAIKASGTWTKAEHDRFLKAMETYPKGPWKAIATMIGTRTVRQTQTHAQKYREKMARRMRGLRNRNGTLQYPGMLSASTASDGAVLYGFREYAVATGEGGTVTSHGVASYDRVNALYQPASAYTQRHYQFPHEQYAHAPQPLYHAQPVYHQVLPVHMVEAHTSQALSSSMEFGQLGQQGVPSAYIATAAYSASWDPPREVSGGSLAVSLPPPQSATGVSVPGGGGLSRARLNTSTPSSAEFDESMDFLMHMYAAHPSQMNTPASVPKPNGHQQM